MITQTMVWINNYDSETDDVACETSTPEHLTLSAARPNCDHVAIPCAPVPGQVYLRQSLIAEELK